MYEESMGNPMDDVASDEENDLKDSSADGSNPSGEDDSPDSIFDSADEREVTGDSVKVAVDWIEFEGALENNSPDLRSFLNVVTGDVIRIFEGGDESDIKLRQAEESGDFLFIEPISSREQYRWMEEFIEVVEEPTLKDKLNIAIDGKGAFRRFKDVLMGYPSERERWFSKRSTKLHAHMAEWLKTKNVVSTNTPPWESGGDNDQHSADDKRGRVDADSRGWRDTSGDLRSMAHDMLDLVPSRELPTAVAFLEFLRGRRSFRRQSYM